MTSRYVNILVECPVSGDKVSAILNMRSEPNSAVENRNSSLTAESGLRLFGDMVRIRAFEERVRQMSRAGLVPGLVHLYSGQEAVAVGVAAALSRDDTIASHHRGHGHCLARGAAPTRLFAEILGREGGYGLGRGGSMHILDPATRNLGTNGIVGGGVPLATGAALTARNLGQAWLAVAFFGDGAMNQGVVFECLNMAVLWKLPVIYVCENNHYGEFTRGDEVTAGTLSGRAAAFGMPVTEIDGMDVLAVNAAAREAVARARSGGGPSFLLCDTWRFSGHHAGDAQSYKDKAETEAWAARDPIAALGRRLVADGLADDAALETMRTDIEADVTKAAEQARALPEPAPARLDQHLHG
jgi:acetoin:2,6-dichlorophenolindophenol oxidoreductase subunit alpha